METLHEMKKQLEEARYSAIESEDKALQEDNQNNDNQEENNDNYQSEDNQELEDNIEEKEQDESTGDDEDEEEQGSDNEQDDEISHNKKAARKFQEMRQDAKRKEQEIIELRERLARIEGATEERNKGAETTKEETPPSYEDDPDGYFRYSIEQSNKQINDLKSQLEQTSKLTEKQKAESAYIEMEKQYATEHDKEYLNAKKFLVDKLKNDIKNSYPTATDEQINQHIKEQEYGLVAGLANSGFTEKEIFATIKHRAVNNGYKSQPFEKKRDTQKLKRNIDKSQSLNDASSAHGVSDEISFKNMTTKKYNQILNEKGINGLKKALDKARINSYD